MNRGEWGLSDMNTKETLLSNVFVVAKAISELLQATGLKRA